MATFSPAKGTTSRIMRIFVQDSSVTTGAGLTGLLFNSAGIKAYFMRDGDTGPTNFSLATATLGTYTSGGFRECDATNFPGYYEVGIPNGVMATGATSASVLYFGAANMTPTRIELELTAWSNQDPIRAGLSALPNASPGAAGGMIFIGNNTAGTIFSSLVVTNAMTLGSFATTGSFTVGSNLVVSGATTFTGIVTHGSTTTFAGAITATSASNNIVGIDVTKISGDSTSATNLKSMLNGTGGVTLSLKQIAIAATDATNCVSIAQTGTGSGIVVSGASTGLSVTGSVNAVSFTGPRAVIVTGTSNSTSAVSITASGTGSTGLSVTGTSIGFHPSSITTGAVNTGNFTTGTFTTNDFSVLGSFITSFDFLVGGAWSVSNITTFAQTVTFGSDLVVSGGTDLDGGLSVVGITNLTLGPNTITSATLATGTITNAKFAAGAIDAASIAAGAITNSKFATGAIDNAAIATDAIGSAELASSAVDKITAATDTVLSTSHGAGLWNKNSSSGSGAFIVTVTVTDNHSVVVPGANVRLTQGINTYVAEADGSGVASFSLDAATYARSVTKSGYTFTPDTMTVSASANFSAVMTINVVPSPPSSPDQCRVYGYVRNQKTGALVANAEVVAYRLPQVPAKANGILIGTEKRATSDSTGRFTIDLEKSASVTPSGSTWTVEIPAAGFESAPLTLSTSTYDLESQIT